MNNKLLSDFKYYLILMNTSEKSEGQLKELDKVEKKIRKYFREDNTPLRKNWTGLHLKDYARKVLRKERGKFW